MRLQLNRVLSICIAIILSLICLPGVTAFSKYYLQFIIAITILGFIAFRSDHQILLNDLFLLFLIIWMGLTLVFSYDTKVTGLYIIVYLFGLYFVTKKWSVELCMKIVNAFLFVSFGMLITQFIEVVDKTFIIKNFFFLYGRGNIETMIHDMRFGIYRGIAGERSEAAYIFSIGSIICMAKIAQGYQEMKKIKINYLFLFFLYTLGIMLSGKRMFFVMIFLMIIVFSMLAERNMLKKSKMILALIGLFIVLYLCSFVIPQLGVIFNRFNESGGNVLNGREILWGYAIKMIKDNFLFGIGYGGYNSYLKGQFGYLWGFQAHNCYLQACAELGIIGFLVWVCYLGSNLIDTVNLVKMNRINKNKEEVFLKWFSLGVQILIIVYAISGNPFYYQRQLVIYFVSIAIKNVVKRRSYNYDTVNKYNYTSL